MLAASVLASLAAVASVAALPSMIGRDNQPPCVPALSPAAYNIFVSGDDSTGWSYSAGQPASVVMTSIGYDSTSSNIEWTVNSVQSGLNILPNNGADSSVCLVQGDNSLLSSGDCDAAATFTVGCQTCSSHFATGCTIESPKAKCVTTQDKGTPLPLDACSTPAPSVQMFDFMIVQ